MLAACWPDGTQTRPTGWRIAWPAAALPSAGSATTPHTSAGGRLTQGFSWRRALCDLPTPRRRRVRCATTAGQRARETAILSASNMTGQLPHHRRVATRRSGGLHGYDRVPDSDLVTFLQPLGCLNAAPVQPGAVGRAHIFDVPPAAGNLEARVATGGEFIVDDQAAFPAHGELSIKGTTAVCGLDDQGPGRRPH